MIKEELYELSLPYYSGENKKVRVYVPEHEEAETLPVIYMTDGQNLFEDNNPGQFGCWYTREAIKEVGKAIIVGIHNDEGPVQRTRELTPKSIGDLRFPDEMPQMIRELLIPEGEPFDDFVIRTVMPEVEACFPVEIGRNAAAFCGSSSGGLQAYFTALSHPDMFCMSGVFSPAFPFYSVDDIVSWTASGLSGSMPYLYFYSGAVGEPEEEICRSTQAVYDAIAEFYPSERLNEVILFDQPHNESAWTPIFKDFLHTFLTRREEF
jgi:enterochelin esterase-like enzyme